MELMSAYDPTVQALKKIIKELKAENKSLRKASLASVPEVREQVEKLTKERDEYKSGFEAAASKYRNLKLQMQEIINVC